MSLSEQVQKDMIVAMRNREELRLSTLRMVKTALKNKEIDKRAPLDEKEELQVFSTLIKQRKDSIDAFERGNRPELAKKEAEEIAFIEAYMPKAVGEEEIVAAVHAGSSELRPGVLDDSAHVIQRRRAHIRDGGGTPVKQSRCCLSCPEPSSSCCNLIYWHDLPVHS